MVVLVAGWAWRVCEAADAGHGAVPGRRRPHVFQLHMWRVTLRAAFGDGLRRRVRTSVMCVPVFNARGSADSFRVPQSGLHSSARTLAPKPRKPPRMSIISTRHGGGMVGRSTMKP